MCNLRLDCSQGHAGRGQALQAVHRPAACDLNSQMQAGHPNSPLVHTATAASAQLPAKPALCNIASAGRTPGERCVQTATQQSRVLGSRVRTFRAVCRRPFSSTCLQPLYRASMTSVLVTSFSLKKCFTRPWTAKMGLEGLLNVNQRGSKHVSPEAHHTRNAAGKVNDAEVNANMLTARRLAHKMAS